ncbi:MAG: hypothetical protein ACP5LA_07425, partial [Thermoplasmata archaeon]
ITKYSMLISALQNETLSSKMLITSYTTSLYDLAVILLIILLFLVFFLLYIIPEVVGAVFSTNKTKKINSSSDVQEARKYYEKAKNRLLAYNYTEDDIEWFFAVRAELMQLSLNPYLFIHAEGEKK